MDKSVGSMTPPDSPIARWFRHCLIDEQGSCETSVTSVFGRHRISASAPFGLVPRNQQVATRSAIEHCLTVRGFKGTLQSQESKKNSCRKPAGKQGSNVSTRRRRSAIPNAVSLQCVQVCGSLAGRKNSTPLQHFGFTLDEEASCSVHVMTQSHFSGALVQRSVAVKDTSYGHAVMHRFASLKGNKKTITRGSRSPVAACAMNFSDLSKDSTQPVCGDLACGGAHSPQISHLPC